MATDHGTRLTDEHIKHATLSEQLNEIDEQLKELAIKKFVVQEELAKLNKKMGMRTLALEFGEVVKKGKDGDNFGACLYANTVMLPWRHRLCPWHFENTLENLMPHGGPSRFTSTAQKNKFFERIEAALAKDLDALD